MEIQIPPSHEQEAIIASLAKIDANIAATQSLIAKYGAIKKATILLSTKYGEYPNRAKLDFSLLSFLAKYTVSGDWGNRPYQDNPVNQTQILFILSSRPHRRDGAGEIPPAQE